MKSPEVFPGQSIDTVSPDISIAVLWTTLQDAGIPVDTWGHGSAKTIGNLQKEIRDGETVLSVDEDGNLQRSVNVVWLEVLHLAENGDVFYLREDRQVFKDGRVRERDLPASLGEKMKPDEPIETAVYRALQEEIGVLEVSHHHRLGEEVRSFVPHTYPGLDSTYSTFTHLVVVPADEFVADGYVEYQRDKTNYYMWENVRSEGP